MKRLASIALAASLALTGVTATALPGQAQSAVPAAGDRIEIAQTHTQERHRFERRGSDVFLNGQRGSRDRRDGWRQYNGYWFPLAAFSALVFNSIRDDIRDQRRYERWDRRNDRWERRADRNWSRHQRWCDEHYRSYRWSDNTFQPYSGPRRECRSPYWP